MSTRDEVVNGLLAVAAMKKVLAELDRQLREEAREHFTKPGQREPGEIAGQDAGNVQLTKPESSWMVWDDAAWTAWVKKNHPEQMVTVVDPHFTAGMLERLKKSEPAIDKETGELLVPDGIAAKSGQPTLKVYPTKDAPQAVLNVLGDIGVVLGWVHQGEIEAA